MPLKGSKFYAVYKTLASEFHIIKQCVKKKLDFQNP